MARIERLLDTDISSALPFLGQASEGTAVVIEQPLDSKNGGFIAAQVVVKGGSELVKNILNASSDTPTFLSESQIGIVRKLFTETDIQLVGDAESGYHLDQQNGSRVHLADNDFFTKRNTSPDQEIKEEIPSQEVNYTEASLSERLQAASEAVSSSDKSDSVTREEAQKEASEFVLTNGSLFLKAQVAKVNHFLTALHPLTHPQMSYVIPVNDLEELDSIEVRDGVSLLDLLITIHGIVSSVDTPEDRSASSLDAEKEDPNLSSDVIGESDGLVSDGEHTDVSSEDEEQGQQEDNTIFDANTQGDERERRMNAFLRQRELEEKEIKERRKKIVKRIADGKVSWEAGAQCLERHIPTEEFFVEGATQNEKKALCIGCPVRGHCAAQAFEKQEFGVWGGMTERERNDTIAELGGKVAKKRGIERGDIDTDKWREVRFKLGLGQIVNVADMLRSEERKVWEELYEV